MKQAMAALGVLLMLGACATSPHKTVASLDTRDSRYKTKRCEAARREAAAFDEHRDGKVVIGLVGNLLVPFAGTATTFAMDRLRDDERERLNRKVRAACISDPLRGKGRRIASR